MECRRRGLHVFVFMVFMLLSVNSLMAAIPAVERAALIALYNSTNGGSWTDSTGWKTAPLEADGFALSGTEDDWFGVVVEADHVQQLDLDGNNLQGNIPAAIGDLVNLQRIYFQSNALDGPLPVEIGNLNQLTYLYLNSNQLSGILPDELGNLTSLERFYLHTNKFEGSIPSTLGQLQNVKWLLLYLNDLCGNIPTELGNLVNLQDFDLHSNSLEGEIPSELGALINLTDFDLRDNQLSGSVPATLGNLTKVKMLDLRTNALSGPIPPELGNMSSVESLYLSDNELAGAIPSELGNLGNVKRLYLDKNELTGSIPPSLGNITVLERLYLNNNQLEGPIPTELTTLSNLQHLYVRTNQLSGPIPPELGNLLNLEELCLHGNLFTGNIPSELGNLVKLKRLNIRDNPLQGEIPAELGNLINLTILDLRSNSLSGSLPAELGNLAKLEILYLHSNRISGQIPSTFINLVSLNSHSSELRYNALYTTDAALRTFLNGKQVGGDWESTQTVAPSNVTVIQTSPTSVTLKWDPISFTTVTGGYQVFYATSSGGPYTEYALVADKSTDSLVVTGLTAGRNYYFVVEGVSNPHSNNENFVISDYSSEVIAANSSPVVSKMQITPLAGLPGTNVQFTNICGGKVNRFVWDFGDGSIEGYRHGTKPGEKFHPNHSYADVGDYTVTLTTLGWEDAAPDTLILPAIICIDPDYAALVVVEGSETHSGYGWAKTIDHDVFGGNGKMTANLPDVECVYNFADSTVRNVNRVRLFIDDVYKTNYPGHLAGKFEVWVSVDNVSWTQALATSIPWQYRGRFASFTFPPVLGRYVKLKLTEPHNPNAEIIQLTEFQVFGAEGEDTTLEKALLTDNAPITEFKLAQNYPNPFNPTTTISFALPEAANVTLRVYNINGRMVSELVNGRQDAGRHQVVFDASDLTSGVYFSVMRSGSVEQVSRMILMK